MADARGRFRAVADCLHRLVQNAFALLKPAGMIMSRKKGFYIRVFIQNIQNLRTVPHIGVGVVVQQRNMGDENHIFIFLLRLLQSGAEPAARFGGKHSVPFAELAPRMFDFVLFILRITFRARRRKAADIKTVEHNEFNSSGFESVEQIVKPEQTLQFLFGIFHKVMVAHDIFHRMNGFRILFQNRRDFVFIKTVAQISKTDNEIKFFRIEFMNSFTKQNARLPENASSPGVAVGKLDIADQRKRNFRLSRLIHTEFSRI